MLLKAKHKTSSQKHKSKRKIITTHILSDGEKKQDNSCANPEHFETIDYHLCISCQHCPKLTLTVALLNFWTSQHTEFLVFKQNFDGLPENKPFD